MNENHSQTESLLDIIKGVENASIALPEFQRDFRWEMDQTYDLFDSLIKDIFIGTVIYGKPSFGMTVREIDQRPRKGKGSNALLKITNYDTSEITKLAQTQNLRIVLDGQQRLTSIYRAIKGIDNVFVVLREDIDKTSLGKLSLEEMVNRVEGTDDSSAISVRLSDAYKAETETLDDEDINSFFQASAFAKAKSLKADTQECKDAERIYRRGVTKIRDLFKQQKMVAFYLLDMSLDKFCLFFERSNSRGIQLDFTDILAAKLYHGFNLRAEMETFESQSKFKLNREIVVRAIAYIVAAEDNRPIKIDKKTILESLDAKDFQAHWSSVCNLFSESLKYLGNQHYILSQDWMPSENMVLPVMMFLRQIKGFDQMSESQREFLQFWYWSSVFSNRYSTASNEAIIADSGALVQVALGQKISARNYFIRLRSLITEPSDLFSYNKKSSTIYRGVLNFLGFVGHGLKDWKSAQEIDVTMRLEDHHIYPRAYVIGKPSFIGIDKSLAEERMDCVVNRTLIPKILNIQIGKKSPSQYLSEIEKQQNPKLAECLATHLLPKDMIHDSSWDDYFSLFLDERADHIFNKIETVTSLVAPEMIKDFGTLTDTGDLSQLREKAKLKDLLALGKVQAGEQVYTRKRPDQFAIIVDGDTVNFNGQIMLINTWGQQMTGWSSISIYDSVFLKRTGQPLKTLRDS